MRKLFDQDEVAESEWKKLPEEDGEVCSEGHQHSEKGWQSKMKKKLCLRVFQKKHFTGRYLSLSVDFEDIDIDIDLNFL